MREAIMLSVLMLALTGCRSMELENKAIQISPGDSKDRVIQVMGVPGDRQFQGDFEVWQYCVTGAGFGYHDYRAIWFRKGQVTGISSYKDSTPASSCKGHFKTFTVEDAPRP
jgi:hypothetical protein